VKFSTAADGTKFILALDEHTAHKKPPRIAPPPSVLRHECLTALRSGCGMTTSNVRRGGTASDSLQDADKAQRWKACIEKEYCDGGVGIEDVRHFNSKFGCEFVLGEDEIAVDYVNCATAWQRKVVADAVAELADNTLADADRHFDGVLFVDMTYSPCDDYYMQTTCLYNFFMRKTIPVLVTWLKRASGLSYMRHFDAFFEEFDVLDLNPDRQNARFKLNGWIMDYSDAQMMGLEVSFGKWVL